MSWNKSQYTSNAKKTWTYWFKFSEPPTTYKHATSANTSCPCWTFSGLTHTIKLKTYTFDCIINVCERIEKGWNRKRRSLPHVWCANIHIQCLAMYKYCLNLLFKHCTIGRFVMYFLPPSLRNRACLCVTPIERDRLKSWTILCSFHVMHVTRTQAVDVLKMCSMLFTDQCFLCPRSCLWHLHIVFVAFCSISTLVITNHFICSYMFKACNNTTINDTRTFTLGWSMNFLSYSNAFFFANLDELSSKCSHTCHSSTQ